MMKFCQQSFERNLGFLLYAWQRWRWQKLISALGRSYWSQFPRKVQCHQGLTFLWRFENCLYTSKYNLTTTKRAYFAFDMPLGMANPFIFTTQLKILYRINQIEQNRLSVWEMIKMIEECLFSNSFSLSRGRSKVHRMFLYRCKKEWNVLKARLFPFLSRHLNEFVPKFTIAFIQSPLEK